MERGLAAIKARGAFVALTLAAMFSAAAYVILPDRHSSHASLIYVCLLHLVVLPLLAFYWHAWKGTDSNATLPNFAWAAGLIFLVAALWVGLSIRHGRIISDESAYRFQARIFASGRLKAEAMPGARANPAQVPVEIYFEHTLQTPDGWFAKYPPGWPLILAIGTWLRCPWLLNPLFGALQLIVMWRVARLWGWNTQVLSVSMAATSPYMVINNAGYMSHACEALLSLLALALVIRGVRCHRLKPIAGSFSLAAIAILVRPFTGAVVFLLLAAIVVLELRRQHRLLLKSLLIATMAGLISLAGFLLVNRAFTGHALLSPYALARGGASIGELTFNPARIVGNVLSIWRWSLTATLCVTFPFMFLFAAYACLRERQNRRVLLYLASLFPLLIAAYCLQSDGSGSFIGERYYYEGFCPLAMVAGRGLELLFERWQTRRRAALAGLAVLFALQFVTLGCAWRQVAAVIHPYNEAYTLATRPPLRPLVFLGGNTDYFTSKHVNWNLVNWRAAPVIYLNDPGPARRGAVACRFGRGTYRAVWWDQQTNRMATLDAAAACPP